jgi:hypothetical protein
MFDAIANFLSYSATGVSNCLPERLAGNYQLPVALYQGTILAHLVITFFNKY